MKGKPAYIPSLSRPIMRFTPGLGSTLLFHPRFVYVYVEWVSTPLLPLSGPADAGVAGQDQGMAQLAMIELDQG